jgi:hypothetical protein
MDDIYLNEYILTTEIGAQELDSDPVFRLADTYKQVSICPLKSNVHIIRN